MNVASPSRDEIAARARAAGLQPDARQLDELMQAAPYVAAVLARLAAAGRDEPAHVFVPASLAPGAAVDVD